MIDLQELQDLKRVHFQTVIAASETGGLSIVETADLSVRLNSRLLAECERLLRERDGMPKHRDVHARHALHQPRQQSLPFVATPGGLS